MMSTDGGSSFASLTFTPMKNKNVQMTFIVLIQEHIGWYTDYYDHRDAFLRFTLRKTNINMHENFKRTLI